MKLLRWVDDNIERVIILVAYVTMTTIVFVEVIRRFVWSVQAAWSTTIPIYMFLWIVWIGCAYNVKIRAHLSFDELRARMPQRAQFACLMLDAFLWVLFSAIVIYFTLQQVLLSQSNFAIVMGTDTIMQWWFYTGTPLAFALLIFRVLQNVRDDVSSYRSGRPLKVQTGIFGD